MLESDVAASISFCNCQFVTEVSFFFFLFDLRGWTYMEFYAIFSCTHRIVTQPRLPWWPQIDLVYARSSELRALFTDTLNKATQGYIAHTPLRMITSLTLKAKDSQSRLTRPDDGPAHKALLLLMVRLIHADPMLLLNVSTIAVRDENVEIECFP